MLSLNLISPDQKKVIKIRGFYIMLKNLTIMFLILIIIISIILLLSKMILQNNFNRIVSESTLNVRYSKIVGAEIAEFNKDLAIIDEIQKDYIKWTHFMSQLFNQASQGISFYNIDIDTENKLLIIRGFAATRDDLLRFEENLNNFSLISGAKIPLKNLLTKKSIDFNIEAQLNIEAIKDL